MIQQKINDVQFGYDLLADEYARRIYGELEHKPLDRELLDRFTERVLATRELPATWAAGLATLRVICADAALKSAAWICPMA
jgi:hypothetical protein